MCVENVKFRDASVRGAAAAQDDVGGSKERMKASGPALRQRDEEQELLKGRKKDFSFSILWMDINT